MKLDSDRQHRAVQREQKQMQKSRCGHDEDGDPTTTTCWVRRRFVMPTIREATPARGRSYGGAALLIAAAAVAHDDDDDAVVGVAAEAIWSSWSCNVHHGHGHGQRSISVF